MRRSIYVRNPATSQNGTLDFMMLKVFQSVARKKDAGVTSDDMIVAMRRQNPYKFVSKDVHDLVHSAVGTDGIDVVGFRNFAARIISENLENYLNEFIEALQVGNEGCLNRYRLEMLFCQEIGVNVHNARRAFDLLGDNCVITVETLWQLLEENRWLLISLVRHIFRKEINADSGDEVLDRLTTTTAEIIGRKPMRQCCSLL